MQDGAAVAERRRELRERAARMSAGVGLRSPYEEGWTHGWRRIGVPRIALIAHDEKKRALADWVDDHRETMGACDLFCTGSTGGVLMERCPELRVWTVKSGPFGGDQQIGGMIAEGRMDALIFFVDPMTAMPHDVDIKALMRLAIVYDLPMAFSPSTADVVLGGLFNGLPAIDGAAHVDRAEYVREARPAEDDRVDRADRETANRAATDHPSAESATASWVEPGSAARRAAWPAPRRLVPQRRSAFIARPLKAQNGHADGAGVEAEIADAANAAEASAPAPDISPASVAPRPRIRRPAQVKPARRGFRRGEAAHRPRRILMLVGDLVDEAEALGPYQTLRALGHEVDVAAPDRRAGDVVRTGSSRGDGDESGRAIRMDVDFDDIAPVQYDALILPGGQGVERLRRAVGAHEMVRGFAAAGKPIAAIGKGAQMLASSDVIRGRRIAGDASSAAEVKRAGAHLAELEAEEALVDGQFVTAPAWTASPQLMRGFLEALG